jgi:hypothetical protein
MPIKVREAMLRFCENLSPKLCDYNMQTWSWLLALAVITNQLFGMHFKHVLSQPHFWGKCEVAIHTPENGSLESLGTPENSKDDCRDQNTSHWGVLYTIGKVLKSRCPKWPLMSHLDICSPSYGQKKGRESNWQFDSRPQKVGNRPAPDLRWGSAIWRWKALDKSYNISSDLVSIGGWGEKLWLSKVPGVQTGIVSGLHFGSPETKSHSDVASAE